MSEQGNGVNEVGKEMASRKLAPLTATTLTVTTLTAMAIY